MRFSAGCVVVLLLPVVLLAQAGQSPVPAPESDHEILLVLYERTQRIQEAVDKTDSSVGALEASIAEIQASQARIVGQMETAFAILIPLVGLLIAALGWMGNNLHKHAQAIQKLTTLLEQRGADKTRAAGLPSE